MKFVQIRVHIFVISSIRAICRQLPARNESGIGQTRRNSRPDTKTRIPGADPLSPDPQPYKVQQHIRRGQTNQLLRHLGDFLLASAPSGSVVRNFLIVMHFVRQKTRKKAMNLERWSQIRTASR